MFHSSRWPQLALTARSSRLACFLSTLVVACTLLSVVGTRSVMAADEPGFTPIFDGKTLNGWDGNPDFWRVEDGTITGQTTAEKPTKGNTFLIYRKGDVGEFELKLEYKIVGGNSGIQYRSFEVPNEKWVVGGYQADIDSGPTYSGINYGERFRGILAGRGQKTVIGDDHKPKEVGKVGYSNELQKMIKQEVWNEYHIIAKDFNFIHKINGRVTSEVTDEDTKERRATGIIALQLHAGPPMKVQFRKLRIKAAPAAANKPESNKQSAAPAAARTFTVATAAPAVAAVAAPAPAAAPAKKRVVFVAGKPSHGYGAHEHYAGSVLLAKELQASGLGYTAEVLKNGWPEDAKVLEGADAIVMYSDGGGGHMVMPHLKAVDALAKKGVGIACLHYAVEVPKGEAGDRFLDWIGGYFEMNWSVNPHWTAKFAKFPDHPVARGVKPFEINDEWYYHMRFRPNMEGVTPILTDLPPDSTLSRPDGGHSGNPDVRAAIAKKEPQHVAWVAERKDGGRGFGFTGGHDHWNWGDPNFRKLVLNAIVWISKGDVPVQGVNGQPVSLDDLESNQDFQQPANFNRDQIRQRLHLPADKKSAAAGPAPKALFSSKIITPKTPGHSETIDVDIKGSKELFLVVTDGGDGFGYDWADWAEPRLVGPAGEKKLTELKWSSATAEWGSPQVDKNADGKPLRINGQAVPYGIGTHAHSVIRFEVPAGYERFKARVGLDNGGTDQNGGAGGSVQFHLFNQAPRLVATAPGAPATAGAPQRDPAEAVAGLDVAEGLEATLFAAEPQVLNLTNMDIDARGRVWVCEVVNYRGHNGKRAEGDRILILEDTDHDGKADKTTVFYQGRDVDSAMGICVLGNKVIVSCSPNILVFTDENGDDVPEKKEVLFSQTGTPQHDHSAHSFLFGPDGKYYWNFGNTGGKVCDAKGEPITDLAGNKVVDNGKPYYGGMPFRCNADGSGFEVLGHNFRNNYETTVDSFGTLWQSDNDDDGNRGVRINYVMEFGNYGYRDELTGAGWQAPRTNLEKEIPHRHWHLNDPGVVPNLLQTGAGSPTGITVYEGRLLPKVFWDQVIHCDAGPNVVRAYPVKPDGAGYKAEIIEILKGTRDNWFRPADVCVAPDGSLFVTDWYDPGVGGHAQGDSQRGRLFRVVPKGQTKYEVPKHDFQTIEGAITALQSPNAAVRYLAWTALMKDGAKAIPALEKLAKESDNPRHRARAIWLLGKMPGQAAKYVAQAAADSNSDLRCVSIRLARQTKVDLVPLLKQLVKDPSPHVRRECVLALRHSTAAEAPGLWAELALAHDGVDRWYLEALGIGADRQWDAYLDAWMQKVGSNWDTAAGHDVIWRSRAARTPELIAKIMSNEKTSVGELPRYFRALDFQTGAAKEDALIGLAFEARGGDAERQNMISSEALKRIGAIDIAKNAKHAAALEQMLSKIVGTPSFVEMVNKFQVASRYPELLKLAQARPDDQLGVDAMLVLVQREQAELLKQGLGSAEPVVAAATARALGNVADGRTASLLLPIVNDPQRDLELRRQATRGLASTKNGAQELLKLAESKKLDEALVSAASFQLHAAQWPEVKAAAVKLFPLPPAKDRELPAIGELVKMKGDVTRGTQVFAKTADCGKCHVVNGQGKEVGPNLSEIGGKLSRQAFFESILYPSAGIAHSYETYVAVLADGNTVTGIKTSETPTSVTLKTADAIQRVFDKKDVEELKKQNISLMPADLQKTMTTQDLVDVVEYLTTLKK
ncbi:MAG: PVC-type heme-binding CxxCH protein [Planctomycetota bacterium]